MIGGKITRKYFSIILFIILFLLNPWVYKLFSRQFFVFTFLVFYCVLLVVGYYKNKFAKVTIFFLIFLAILQIRSVNIANVYKLTPAEIDLQTTRMNYYEPRFARLGYYLEKQPITILFYRLEKNFFDIVDINVYFPDYYNLISLPFLLVGIFKLFSSKNTQKYLLLGSIFILTFIGVNGDYGPFLIFPFFGFSTFLGVVTLVKKIRGLKIV